MLVNIVLLSNQLNWRWYLNREILRFLSGWPLKCLPTHLFNLMLQWILQIYKQANPKFSNNNKDNFAPMKQRSTLVHNPKIETWMDTIPPVILLEMQILKIQELPLSKEIEKEWQIESLAEKNTQKVIQRNLDYLRERLPSWEEKEIDLKQLCWESKWSPVNWSLREMLGEPCKEEEAAILWVWWVFFFLDLGLY